MSFTRWAVMMAAVDFGGGGSSSIFWPVTEGEGCGAAAFTCSRDCACALALSASHCAMFAAAAARTSGCVLVGCLPPGLIPAFHFLTTPTATWYAFSLPYRATRW